ARRCRAVWTGQPPKTAAEPSYRFIYTTSVRVAEPSVNTEPSGITVVLEQVADSVRASAPTYPKNRLTARVGRQPLANDHRRPGFDAQDVGILSAGGLRREGS